MWSSCRLKKNDGNQCHFAMFVIVLIVVRLHTAVRLLKNNPMYYTQHDWCWTWHLMICIGTVLPLCFCNLIQLVLFNLCIQTYFTSAHILYINMALCPFAHWFHLQTILEITCFLMHACSSFSSRVDQVNMQKNGVMTLFSMTGMKTERKGKWSKPIPIKVLSIITYSSPPINIVGVKANNY